MFGFAWGLRVKMTHARLSGAWGLEVGDFRVWGFVLFLNGCEVGTFRGLSFYFI